jgi:hypothetical protein
VLLSEQKYTRNRFENLQALRLPLQNIWDKTKPASSRQENGRMQASLENIRQKTCRLEAVASPQSAGCLLLRSHSLLTSISSFFGLYRTFHRRFSFETVKNDWQGNEFLSTLE